MKELKNGCKTYHRKDFHPKQAFKIYQKKHFQAIALIAVFLSCGIIATISIGCIQPGIKNYKLLLDLIYTYSSRDNQYIPDTAESPMVR